MVDIIPPNSAVLDLGCGEGTFLRLLKESKNVRGVGLEIKQDNILKCIANGVNVIQSDLNTGLHFNDNSFDFVILSRTLQAVDRPDRLLAEMLRVGRKGIISLINIGYYRARLQLTLGGKMPRTKILPAQWYSTENIHLCTVKDFRELCREKEIKITREIPLGGTAKILRHINPNLFAPLVLFVVER